MPETSDTVQFERARAVYDSLRPRIETEENIGKIVVLDPESGDYEIDELGIETALRLKERHPGADLYGFRIGHKTVDRLAGAFKLDEDIELTPEEEAGLMLGMDQLDAGQYVTFEDALAYAREGKSRRETSPNREFEMTTVACESKEIRP